MKQAVFEMGRNVMAIIGAVAILLAVVERVRWWMLSRVLKSELGKSVIDPADLELEDAAGNKICPRCGLVLMRTMKGVGGASCTAPPSGWVCSRAAGHDGPCAASPAKEG